MTPASPGSFPEMFPWLNVCTTFEPTEQASMGLVVMGEKDWAGSGDV